MVKKPAKHTASHSERIAETWRRRPWLTLSTVAAVFGILSVVGPWISSGLHHYVTRDELTAHQKHDESKDAWAALQLLRLEVVQARNRVNDCDIAKAQNRSMTALESAACATYRDEFDEANRKFEAKRVEAMATTKESP